MKRVITGHEDFFGPWLMNQLGGQWFPGRGSIVGLWQDGIGPIAACLFEGHNGASIMMHLAGVGGKWMNREFLWFCFYYPFEQLQVQKTIGLVESDNTKSRRLVEHLGFTLEATLKNCAPSGDLLVYTMTREQCRWLALGNRYRGQINTTDKR